MKRCNVIPRAVKYSQCINREPCFSDRQMGTRKCVNGTSRLCGNGGPVIAILPFARPHLADRGVTQGLPAQLPSTACWPSPPAIPGIVIPAMAMPSIFMPPTAESWDEVCAEWQSEFIEANAQERSHAAVSDDTHRSSATIEPAKMRLISIPSSILRQSIAALQHKGMWTSGSVSGTVYQEL